MPFVPLCIQENPVFFKVWKAGIVAEGYRKVVLRISLHECKELIKEIQENSSKAVNSKTNVYYAFLLLGIVRVFTQKVLLLQSDLSKMNRIKQNFASMQDSHLVHDLNAITSGSILRDINNVMPESTFAELPDGIDVSIPFESIMDDWVHMNLGYPNGISPRNSMGMMDFDVEMRVGTNKVGHDMLDRLSMSGIEVQRAGNSLIMEGNINNNNVNDLDVLAHDHLDAPFPSMDMDMDTGNNLPFDGPTDTLDMNGLSDRQLQNVSRLSEGNLFLANELQADRQLSMKRKHVIEFDSALEVKEPSEKNKQKSEEQLMERIKNARMKRKRVNMLQSVEFPGFESFFASRIIGCLLQSQSGLHPNNEIRSAFTAQGDPYYENINEFFDNAADTSRDVSQLMKEPLIKMTKGKQNQIENDDGKYKKFMDSLDDRLERVGRVSFVSMVNVAVQDVADGNRSIEPIEKREIAAQHFYNLLRVASNDKWNTPIHVSQRPYEDLFIQVDE